jgi:hypothetical protein
MTSIVTRQTSGAGAIVKNLPLSNAEIDTNFINIVTDKIEQTDAVSTNTSNKVVRRGASGEFSSGSITVTGSVVASSSGQFGGNISATGTGSIGGDLAVNGGDITTTAATFNLVSSATTLSLGLGATSVTLGNTSGSLTLRNPTISASSSNATLKSIGVGTSASGTTGEIRASGNISSNYSDERLKTDIAEIENALEKVCSLRGVTYVPNGIAESFGFKKQQEVGVLAGDVEKVLPEAIKPAPFDRILFEGADISRSGQDYKTVQYEKLVPLLIEAIKDLNKQVRELKGVK